MNKLSGAINPEGAYALDFEDAATPRFDHNNVVFDIVICLTCWKKECTRCRTDIFKFMYGSKIIAPGYRKLLLRSSTDKQTNSKFQLQYFYERSGQGSFCNGFDIYKKLLTFKAEKN